MLNEKNFELNENDLDRVVGGTLTEVNQLADAFASKAGALGRFVADAHSALNGKSGLVDPANILLRKNGLSELGISHDLSVGFLGTGAGSSANKYSYGGKSISHGEVLQMISAAEVA